MDYFWIFRKIGQWLGFVENKEDEGEELLYRMSISPLPGISERELVATGKKMFPDHKAAVPDMVRDWVAFMRANDTWQAQSVFSFQELPLETVERIRKTCQTSIHYRVVYDEHKELQHQTMSEAKRLIKKKSIEDIVDQSVLSLEELGDMEKHVRKYVLDDIIEGDFTWSD